MYITIYNDRRGPNFSITSTCSWIASSSSTASNGRPSKAKSPLSPRKCHQGSFFKRAPGFFYNPTVSEDKENKNWRKKNDHCHHDLIFGPKVCVSWLVNHDFSGIFGRMPSSTNINYYASAVAKATRWFPEDLENWPFSVQASKKSQVYPWNQRRVYKNTWKNERKKWGGSPRLDPNLVSWFWWAEMLRKLQNLTFVLADHSGVVAWYPIGVCSAVTWDIESRIRICGEWWICSFHFISIQFCHSFLAASFYEFQFFSG